MDFQFLSTRLTILCRRTSTDNRGVLVSWGSAYIKLNILLMRINISIGCISRFNGSLEKKSVSVEKSTLNYKYGA